MLMQKWTTNPEVIFHAKYVVISFSVKMTFDGIFIFMLFPLAIHSKQSDVN